jgi:hypothetical protein
MVKREYFGFPSRTWMLQEGYNKLNIKMPSESFLVEIHTSSKIITLKKMSNFKLMRNWLRDAYFEMMGRIKWVNKNSETCDFGDSDDMLIIIRNGDYIVIEVQGNGLSCLTREELMQARRKLTKIIYEIYEIKRNRNRIKKQQKQKEKEQTTLTELSVLADCLEDYEDDWEEDYGCGLPMQSTHGVIHTM